MIHPLLAELSHHEFFRAQLRGQFPDLDDHDLADTLEGLTDLREMIAHTVRSALEDRMVVEALKGRIGDMQERLQRLDHRATAKRDLVSRVMERAGMDKLIEPDFTVALRAGPRPLVISDEAAIPAEFWVPQPPKLDRKGLGDRLKAGETVPGTLLGNGGVSISVRVK